jgi:glycosyltransferase involved in cell wall biosynthesis
MNELALYRGRRLRVLHGTYEIAGQGLVLARGLASLGVDARSFAYKVDWDGRISDIVVDLDRAWGPPGRAVKMVAALARWARFFDVFHFHFGTSFLSFPLLRRIDVPLLRAMGKVVVYHFHGCEVRNRAHMITHHRLATCTECDPFCIPSQQKQLLADASRNADAQFYSTLDLSESVPHGVNLPLAIESERWIAAGREHPLPDADRRDGVHGPVVVMHAPTNKLIKGTDHVVAAVERLRAEFPKLELELIEKQPWAEMPALLAQCDILVDQLMMGWYGLLAIEGMAEGKPVIAYMRDDFVRDRPDIPVISAEPGTIQEVLRGLIRDPARRAAIGARGPEFVRARHDARVVADVLLTEYQRLLEPGA